MRIVEHDMRKDTPFILVTSRWVESIDEFRVNTELRCLDLELLLQDRRRIGLCQINLFGTCVIPNRKYWVSRSVDGLLCFYAIGAGSFNAMLDRASAVWENYCT